MSDLFYGKTREDWIAELERELRWRHQVYTKSVRERRMNARQAAWQIDTLQDLLNHLRENPSWQPKPPPMGNGSTTTAPTG
jgi:hypothetical protein